MLDDIVKLNRPLRLVLPPLSFFSFLTFTYHTDISHRVRSCDLIVLAIVCGHHTNLSPGGNLYYALRSLVTLNEFAAVYAR